MKTSHMRSLMLMWLLLCSTVMAAELPGRYVELSTVRLWMLDTGGEGEAILLFHPMTGTSAIWQHTLPALAKAGYRAIAIDIPGWGKSIVHDTQNPIAVAEMMEQLLDHPKLPKAHVVGTAIGGYIALDFAAAYPSRSRSLVIVSSGLGLEGDPEYDAFRERAEIPGMREVASVFREVSPNYRATNPEGVDAWLAIYNNSQQPDTPRRPALRSSNTPAKLASIKAPTLFIAGGIDLVTPSGGMRLYSRHMTVEHDFIVMPEAGHVLVWEQPQEFSRHLIDFLQQH